MEPSFPLYVGASEENKPTLIVKACQTHSFVNIRDPAGKLPNESSQDQVVGEKEEFRRQILQISVKMNWEWEMVRSLLSAS